MTIRVGGVTAEGVSGPEPGRVTRKANRGRGRRRARQVGLVLLCVGLVCALAGGALALSNPALLRHVIAGGGGRAEGGAYVLQGTIGQPSTGTARGDGFALSGGFWAGPGAPEPGGYGVYLPLVLRE